MQEFILAYHGGKQFKSPEEGKAHMAKRTAWNSRLGGAVVNPGSYFGSSKTVSADGVVDGGGLNPISGISVLQADTLEAVLELAKTCPHLDIGGTIEVAQMNQMLSPSASGSGR